ncbi:MAG: DUF4332 domain-containing protein [Bacillota bacterium]
MSYGVELNSISLFEYKEMLKKKDLLPGRRILQDNIDDKFERLFACGITNLDELYKSMSNPQKHKSLLTKTGISNEYITILKREIGSFIQKPVPIADFPGILPDVKNKLFERSIKTSKDVYELSNGFRELNIICNIAGISKKEALELFSLCDMVRINGVGAVFSRILFEAGFKRITDIANEDAAEMLKKVSEINSKKKYTKAKLGKKDMQFCIEYAKVLIRK